MEIALKLDSLKVLEKTPSRFGNSSHVFVSKKLERKKVKIISGKSKLEKNQLKISFYNSELIEREVKKFGTSCHIILPKNYSGKKIKLLMEENE